VSFAAITLCVASQRVFVVVVVVVVVVVYFVVVSVRKLLVTLVCVSRVNDRAVLILQRFVTMFHWFIVRILRWTLHNV
jgi:hypothetical protein